MHCISPDEKPRLKALDVCDVDQIHRRRTARKQEQNNFVKYLRNTLLAMRSCAQSAGRKCQKARSCRRMLLVAVLRVWVDGAKDCTSARFIALLSHQSTSTFLSLLQAA